MQWTPVICVLLSIVFGIITMMILLDTNISTITKPKCWLFFIGVLTVLVGNFLVIFIMGIGYQSKYYMLLVHLPLAIMFWIITGIHLIKIIFTLFTAVFLIFPASIFSNLMARANIVSLEFGATICFIVAIMCIFFLVEKFLKKDFNYLIQHYGNRSFLKLVFLPVIYNMSTYWVGRYDYTLTIPIDNLIFRSILFLMAFTAYLLVLDIARTDRENQKMKHEQTIFSLQLESANKQMISLRTMQEQTKIYRHDMRHHLSLLFAFAADGALEKITEYLSHVEASINAITPVRYCENEVVNLVLSSFDAMAKKVGVTLCMDVILPQELGINDPELCSLLSNALDNAINAAAKIDDDERRRVYIRALIRDSNLLISTENYYLGKIEIDGGLPKSQKNAVGHGFGIKSMVSIVEHNAGIYSFEITDGVFVLQLMLPMYE